MKLLAWLALALAASAGPAAAGALNNPLIAAVNYDKSRVVPGGSITVTATLVNKTGAAFTGQIAAHLTNGRGIEVLAAQSQAISSLAAGAQASISFTYAMNKANASAPDLGINNRGYLVDLQALNGSSAMIDEASASIPVESDWAVFPRYGFVSGASVTAGSTIAQTIANLASYRLNALQWYDVNWKHHLPYSPASTWPNLANIPIDRATLQAGLAAAASFGMMNFDYQLWNGAYPNSAADGVPLGWGSFTTKCAPNCRSANQEAYSGFPSDWAAPGLILEDPGNEAWRAWWRMQMSQLLGAFAFDGVQIDTLGNPGTRWDAAGIGANHGDQLANFTNEMASTLRGQKTNLRMIINPVSGWSLADVMLRARTDVIYDEIHPEFGDTQYYTDLNALARSVRRMTTKGVVIPAYMDQNKALVPTCHTRTPNGTVCYFGDPGIQYIESQMLASGLNHWQLGDFNAACPAAQAKMISNIYVPGPQLCMSAPLQEWVQDARNFEVAYENLLRYGAGDTTDGVSVTAGLPSGVSAGATGAAGTIYLLPKTKAGFSIVHLLNYSQVPTIYNADLNGTQPGASTITNITIKQYFPGNLLPNSGSNGAGSRLMWATPDVRHGAPQQIMNYTIGNDAAGNFITYTLPILQYWTMVWLETAGVTGQDFDIVPTELLRGMHYAEASPGIGGGDYVLGAGCCGRWARYEGLNFGAGLVTGFDLSAQASKAAHFEVRLDAPDGLLLAGGIVPAGPVGSYATASVNLSLAPQGRHDLFLRFPDEAISVGSLRFR